MIAREVFNLRSAFFCVEPECLPVRGPRRAERPSSVLDRAMKFDDTSVVQWLRTSPDQCSEDIDELLHTRTISGPSRSRINAINQYYWEDRGWQAK